MADRDTKQKIIDFWMLNEKIENLEKDSIRQHAEIDTTLKSIEKFQTQSHVDKEKIFTRIENIEKSVSDLSQSVTLFIDTQRKATDKQNKTIEDQNDKLEKAIEQMNESSEKNEKRSTKVVIWVAGIVIASLITGSFRVESRLDSIKEAYNTRIDKNILEVKTAITNNQKKIEIKLDKIIEEKNKNKIEIEVIKTKLNNKGK